MSATPDERAWTDLGVGSDLEGAFDGSKYVDFREKGSGDPLMFASRGVLEKAIALIPHEVLVARIAARFAAQTDFFKVGDPILFGKYKNKRGLIVRVFEDEKGHPSIEVQPVPQGRKKNKIIGLYKIWHDPDPPDPEEADDK